MTEKNMTCLFYYPSKYFDFKYLSRCFTLFCILITHWDRCICRKVTQGIRNCNACLSSSKYHSQILWILDKQSETLWKSMSMVFRELCGKCWAKYFPTRNMMKSIEASKKLYRTNIYLLLKDFMGRWTKTTVNRFLCHRITNKVIKLSVATLYVYCFG